MQMCLGARTDPGFGVRGAALLLVACGNFGLQLCCIDVEGFFVVVIFGFFFFFWFFMSLMRVFAVG